MSKHPRVVPTSTFIGSSSEGHAYAIAIQENLEKHTECTVWDQNFFQLGSTVLEDLVHKASSYDFGIFVISPDDEVLIRGRPGRVGRDNVIFEIGLFMGILGRERTFVLTPSDHPNLFTPSDISGLTTATYSSSRGEKAAASAVAPACQKIRERIISLGPLDVRAIHAPDGSSVRYAAAICFRRESDAPEFLLVNSTRSRRVFPKGKIKSGELPGFAALRYASQEAAAIGHIVDDEVNIFRYMKEEEHKEHYIVAVLIEVTSRHDSKVRFRDPTWYAFKDAKSVLLKDRDYAHGARLVEVLDWANARISRLSIPKEQSGVVAFRIVDAKIQVLLITSKANQRWILPKGNIAPGLSAAESAVKEGIEEAGIEGDLLDTVKLGYSYSRGGRDYDVQMFPLRVISEHRNWPEQGLRERRWVDLAKAATMVEYEEIKQILVNFERSIRKFSASLREPKGERGKRRNA